jgi:hypothetical protein
MGEAACGSAGSRRGVGHGAWRQPGGTARGRPRMGAQARRLQRLCRKGVLVSKAWAEACHWRGLSLERPVTGEACHWRGLSLERPVTGEACC